MATSTTISTMDDNDQFDEDDSDTPTTTNINPSNTNVASDKMETEEPEEILVERSIDDEIIWMMVDDQWVEEIVPRPLRHLLDRHLPLAPYSDPTRIKPDKVQQIAAILGIENTFKRVQKNELVAMDNEVYKNFVFKHLNDNWIQELRAFKYDPDDGMWWIDSLYIKALENEDIKTELGGRLDNFMEKENKKKHVHFADESAVDRSTIFDAQFAKVDIAEAEQFDANKKSYLCPWNPNSTEYELYQQFNVTLDNKQVTEWHNINIDEMHCFRSNNRAEIDGWYVTDADGNFITWACRWPPEACDESDTQNKQLLSVWRNPVEPSITLQQHIIQAIAHTDNNSSITLTKTTTKTIPQTPAKKPNPYYQRTATGFGANISQNISPSRIRSPGWIPHVTNKTINSVFNKGQQSHGQSFSYTGVPRTAADKFISQYSGETTRQSTLTTPINGGIRATTTATSQYTPSRRIRAGGAGGGGGDPFGDDDDDMDLDNGNRRGRDGRGRDRRERRDRRDDRDRRGDRDGRGGDGNGNRHPLNLSDISTIPMATQHTIIGAGHRLQFQRQFTKCTITLSGHPSEGIDHYKFSYNLADNDMYTYFSTSETALKDPVRSIWFSAMQLGPNYTKPDSWLGLVHLLFSTWDWRAYELKARNAYQKMSQGTDRAEIFHRDYLLKLYHHDHVLETITYYYPQDDTQNLIKYPENMRVIYFKQRLNDKSQFLFDEWIANYAGNTALVVGELSECMKWIDRRLFPTYKSTRQRGPKSINGNYGIQQNIKNLKNKLKGLITGPQTTTITVHRNPLNGKGNRGRGRYRGGRYRGGRYRGGNRFGGRYRGGRYRGGPRGRGGRRGRGGKGGT